MIEACVYRHGERILQRTYHDPALSLDLVLKLLELYVVDEQLNRTGECILRARFASLSRNT